MPENYRAEERQPAPVSSSLEINIPLDVLNCYQRKEIEQEHVWFLGQRLGRPVDAEEAALDWALNPNRYDSQAALFRQRINGRANIVFETCKRRCGGFEKCLGFHNCSLTLDEVHAVLNDDPKLIALHGITSDGSVAAYSNYPEYPLS